MKRTSERTSLACSSDTGTTAVLVDEFDAGSFQDGYDDAERRCITRVPPGFDISNRPRNAARCWSSWSFNCPTWKRMRHKRGGLATSARSTAPVPNGRGG